MFAATEFGMIHHVAHGVFQRIGMQQRGQFMRIDHAPDAVSTQQHGIRVVQRQRHAEFHLRSRVTAQAIGDLVALRMDAGFLFRDDAIANQLRDSRVILGARDQAPIAEQIQT